MADWQMKLQLKDVYHSGKAPAEIAAVIASRLKAKTLPAVSIDIAERRDDLVAEFEALAGDPSVGLAEFDGLMSDLYDWADTSLDGQCNGKKLCWVETF